jgi:sRNA-binding carbon storage regulator CsrA
VDYQRRSTIATVIKRSPKPKGGLQLTRTPGTWIQIGTATIHFTKVRGNHMEVTILAPPDVRVMRGELIERAIEKLRGENHEG